MGLSASLSKKKKKKTCFSLSLFLTFFLFFFFRGKGMFVPLSFLELRVEGIMGYGSRVGGREREIWTKSASGIVNIRSMTDIACSLDIRDINISGDSDWNGIGTKGEVGLKNTRARSGAPG